jgi:hypothetical protein
MEKELDMENRLGQMVLIIKENGKKIKRMGMVFIPAHKDCLKDSGLTIKRMEKESLQI